MQLLLYHVLAGLAIVFLQYISPEKGISPPKAERISFSGISPSRVSGEEPDALTLCVWVRKNVRCAHCFLRVQKGSFSALRIGVFLISCSSWKALCLFVALRSAGSRLAPRTRLCLELRSGRCPDTPPGGHSPPPWTRGNALRVRCPHALRINRRQPVVFLYSQSALGYHLRLFFSYISAVPALVVVAGDVLLALWVADNEPVLPAVGCQP